LLHKSLTATHPRLRERLLALACIAEGLPAKVVAQRLGRDRGTVEAWVQRFNAHGLTSLQPQFRGQPGTVLSPAELTHLRDVVQRPPCQLSLQTVLSQTLILVENQKIWYRKFNDLRMPKLPKKHICDRTPGRFHDWQ
jgi:transposase